MQALPLIVSGMSNKAVAEELGCSPWTISHWTCQVPAFQQAVKAELEIVTNRARRLLSANAVQAAKTLIATSKTGSGSANTTKASQLILDRAGIVATTEDGTAVGGISPAVAALMNMFKQEREEKKSND